MYVLDLVKNRINNSYILFRFNEYEAYSVDAAAAATTFTVPNVKQFRIANLRWYTHSFRLVDLVFSRSFLCYYCLL